MITSADFKSRGIVSRNPDTPTCIFNCQKATSRSTSRRLIDEWLTNERVVHI